MARCDELQGKGAVVWPCLLEKGHDGPHLANEYAPSVAARKAWEAKHHSPFEQPTLWTEEDAVELSDREVRHRKARAALEELQGTPQTFWERNGTGDEYPLPSPVEPSTVVAGDEPVSEVAPASPQEVASFIASTASAQLSEAAKAFAGGDSARGMELVSMASGAVSSIAPVLGSVSGGR